jgi:choline dehydrogenase-like flavoprotein
VSDAFDYIVIGSGSAGSLMANRLSADPANRVVLIEAARLIANGRLTSRR